MEYINKLDNLLKDGYSQKFACYYLDAIEEESNCGIFDKEYCSWAHSQGFFVSHACAFKLNKKNVDDYLSEYDYYRLWPLNSWSRIWINDKLTMKYMFYGTRYDKLMPKYYFYSTKNGLIPLMDLKTNLNDLNGALIAVLKDVKEIACKPNNGTNGVGFVKLSFSNNNFYINSKIATKEDILFFANNNHNYIFTEYLRPCKEYEVYSKNIHSLRIVTINPNGNNPKIVDGCVRFPNKKCGESNYIILGENTKNDFNLYTFIDWDDGKLFRTVKTYIDRIEDTPIHPDTKIEINGYLPRFHELKQDILSICDYFSNIEYMGFDIGLTPTGYKIMEINTHPGIFAQQINIPYFKNNLFGPWLKEKINQVNSLSEDEIKVRNKIVR